MKKKKNKKIEKIKPLYKKSLNYILFNYGKLNQVKIYNMIKTNNRNKDLLIQKQSFNCNNFLRIKKNFFFNTIFLIILWNIGIINFINPIFAEKKYIKKKRILQTGLSINLKVTRGDKIKIINTEFIPDRIFINNVKSTIDKNGYINAVEYLINNVTMEWDKKKSKYDKIFQNIVTLIEVDLSNLDTSGVTSMKSMFINCENLKYINFEGVNTSLVNNMTSMFEGCSSLTSLNLSNFLTSKVNYMDNMFKNCFSLSSLNLTSFKVKLKKIKEMFYGCKSLSKLILPNIDTSSITNMDLLFYGCNSLTSLDITNFNTKKLKSMNQMFMGCKSLKSIDLSYMDTSTVTNMNSLFYECESLISLNLSNFITSKITNMESMFSGCKSLIFLDISNFNIKNVDKIGSMFYKCSSLISLNLSHFDLSGKNLEYFFYGCNSLKSIKFSPDIKLVNNIERMFYGCSSLESLNLSNFNFELIENMESLFYGCYSLISLDLSNINAYSAINISNMFSGCKSLKTINFTNFRISSISTINSLFYDCNSLISLDLRNFDTSLVRDMAYAFFNCTKLTSLYISNFDTSLVTNMDSMFYRCNSLTSIDLSGFNTSIVNEMRFMFFNCSQLTSLDLSSFNTQNVNSMQSMFSGCSNLKYLNFYNFFNKHYSNIKDIFYSTSNNLNVCINNESSKQIINEINSKRCIINDCSINISNIKKIIYETKICIEKCQDDDIYKFEFDYNCYNKCPKGTHSNDNNAYLCEINVYECFEDYPFLILDYNICTDECNSKDFFNNICTINNFESNSQSLLIESIIQGIEEGLLDELLTEMVNEKKDDIIKMQNDTLYQITTTFNQNNKEYPNISTIQFGESENIIKEKFNISQNDTLIIFKIEKYKAGLLIPLIDYEIFNPKTKEKLDLNKYKISELNFNIKIPININENNLFKYEQNSSYYNDICFTYKTERGTDITLYDRKKEFNNYNFAICFKNCVYNGYDFLHKKVICLCNFKESLGDGLLNIFKISISSTNFKIMKCFKLLFSKEGLIKNIGNYIFLSIIFFFIISGIYFYSKGYDLICVQINDIVEKKISENKEEINPKSDIEIEDKKNIIENYSSSKINKKNNAFNSKIDISRNNIDSKIDSEINISKNVLSNKYRKDNFKKDKENVFEYLEFEINTIDYKKALEKDKRTYFQFYISLIREKHILLFTFNRNIDYNSYIIKICNFIFSFSLHIVINAFFFNDLTMHRIYIDFGKYNFIYNLPKMIYSIIIISIINKVIKKIFFSRQNILEIKNEKNKYKLKGKVLAVLKCLIIKFCCFFLFGVLFLIFFWYYLSCFCAVYENTQLYLIKNVLIEYSISLIYPFIIWLIPGIFRIYAIRRPGECLYKISQFFQLI